jgi:(R)-citramalate synthase
MKSNKTSRKEKAEKIEKKVEILDTTLRDGEQITHGSFSAKWKLRIAKELFEAGVDRVEICSARGYSKKEQKMLSEVMDWAKKNGCEDKVEVLTFIDGKKSVDWVRQAGGRVISLLTKGSKRHCREQLGQNIKTHLKKIAETVDYAVSCGMKVNIGLEDWSQGMMDSPNYVKKMLAGLEKMPIFRVALCDTMGVLNPWMTEKFVRETIKWQPKIHYDFHGHNDYGLAVANSLAAVQAGAKGVHVTVNGLGERTGNAPLDEVALGIRDHLSDCKSDIKIPKLRPLSRDVALMSGRRVPPNKSISGREVFSNTAGIHADGDRKKNLYAHRWLDPQDFGTKTRHPMGKLSGKANIIFNLERLGWKLSDDQVIDVLFRVVQMADEGKVITLGDLPFIVAAVLNRPELIVFEVLSLESTSRAGKKASTKATARYKGDEFELTGEGDGGFDAFMNALAEWTKDYPFLVIPDLVDYSVNIPPGGKSSALVHTTIEWEVPGKMEKFSTCGVHSDQVLAAIEAAALAVNLCNCNREK